VAHRAANLHLNTSPYRIWQIGLDVVGDVVEKDGIRKVGGHDLGVTSISIHFAFGSQSASEKSSKPDSLRPYSAHLFGTEKCTDETGKTSSSTELEHTFVSNEFLSLLQVPRKTYRRRIETVACSRNQNSQQ
jgi:hypothetical protein